MEVRPLFAALEFDQKQQLASVAWAYCFDGSDQNLPVRIVSALDAKAVGVFAQSTGLSLE